MWISCRVGGKMGNTWWNDEVKKAVEEKKDAYLNLIVAKDDNMWRELIVVYRAKRNEAKKVINRMLERS
jgi:hypothetical protein